MSGSLFGSLQIAGGFREQRKSKFTIVVWNFVYDRDHNRTKTSSKPMLHYKRPIEAIEDVENTHSRHTSRLLSDQSLDCFACHLDQI